MERYKISKLLNNSFASKILRSKWIEVNDLSSDQYSVNKINCYRKCLNRANKKLIFKNNDSLRSCISKINNIFIGNAEELDIVMAM